MTNPTPRPWAVEDTLVISGAPGDPQNYVICDCSWDPCDPDENSANAAHIVHCVNSYEPLGSILTDAETERDMWQAYCDELVAERDELRRILLLYRRWEHASDECDTGAMLTEASFAAQDYMERYPTKAEGGWGVSIVAALYVDPQGTYAELDGVDLWCVDRDARNYRGPHRVVAHPPCQRWGRFWHGSTRKPHQFRLGEDGGCFAAALTSVRNWGGVLEHPAHSKAWDYFGLTKPNAGKGWNRADNYGGWTCQVEQGHYGHISRKATWLYAVGVDLPELDWNRCEQRLHPVAVAKHGYEKARRIGMMAMVGGKDKTRIRNATPPEFRDVLISMCRSI